VENGIVWFTAPSDLKQRLAYLPREVRPEHDHFQLSLDKERISEEIRRTRQEENAAWPAIHYLWPLHPVMEWLSDRALNAFGRHTAPVLRLPGKLAENEHIVLIHGGFPNRRGHVLIQEWCSVHVQGDAITGLLDWGTLKDRLGLEPGALPNPGRSGDTAALRTLLPRAVGAARERLQAVKRDFDVTRGEVLADQHRRLAELKAGHERQLGLDLARSNAPEALKLRQRDDRQAHIDRVFRDHEDWLDNTQQTEDDPYLQVAAVFTGQLAQEGA